MHVNNNRLNSSGSSSTKIFVPQNDFTKRQTGRGSSQNLLQIMLPPALGESIALLKAQILQQRDPEPLQNQQIPPKNGFATRLLFCQ